MLTRRAFLRTLGYATAVGAPVALVGLAWPGPVSRHIRAGLVGLARGRAVRIHYFFSYLSLEPAGVARFVDDWERHVGALPRAGAWPSEVYLRYLLSTDFFRHNADESRLIQYVGFCDPYATPCSNPLAVFD